MGTFDPHADAPDQIRQEGEEITISFERVDSTTGTVTWNIPPPAHGCNASNQAYNGIVILLNTVANKAVTNWPADGTVYVADATADADLHAGDDIEDALVVGAFYNDKTTTSLSLTGLVADTAYFITGHAVDNVNRYHKQGVNTYALPFLYLTPQADAAAFQEVVIGTKGTSRALTDSTGLGGSPSVDYTVRLQIDTIQHTLTVAGQDAAIFSDLITELNTQIKLLETPFQSPTPPNTGAYWYDSATGKLFQWDGDSHVEIPLISELTNPTNISTGEYWVDTDTNILSQWDGSAWVVETTKDVGWDPTSPNCDSFWDQTTGATQIWAWDGTVWCTRTTIIANKDPSCPRDLSCNSFWYDDVNEMLFKWNEATGEWNQTEAIVWDTDPIFPSSSTFWFDDELNQLWQRSGAGSPSWIQQTVTVSEVAPTSPIIGDYWFDPSLQELFTFSTSSPEWVSTPAIVWGSDPSMPGSCELWWQTGTSPNALNVWDDLNDAWAPTTDFTISATDPSDSPTLVSGTVWKQQNRTTGSPNTGHVSGSPATTTLYWEWDGSQFVQIPQTDVIEFLTDPTDVSVGDVWFDNVNGVYYERTVTSPIWTAQDVISSAQDPMLLSVGTFWYDTTNNTLNMWNGATFVNVIFSTTALTPASGALWYDTSTTGSPVGPFLFEWNSKQSAWVISTPIAVVTFNDPKGVCNPGGNIVFTTSLLGSFGQILIGSETTSENLTTFVITSFEFSGTLFPKLKKLYSGTDLKPNVIGSDGLTGVLSTDTIGVGTDGSADERRELADSIRKQLGYPVVEVELTKYQIDQGIQKALEHLRQKSASAYRRVYFFLDATANRQDYLLTNERVGFNKIVNIMGVWRITSAFLSTVHAAGVFGQTILQHLYHMGTYDLVSYHLISDYIEQLEQLFATRITYTFDEGSRQLFMFTRFTRDEKVLIDCVQERTEQEILTSRWTKSWIERWALAECRMMLAEIRGKYATLPGAGGGVSLNAGELIGKAQEDFAICHQEIDDFVVNDIENLGIGSELIIG